MRLRIAIVAALLALVGGWFLASTSGDPRCEEFERVARQNVRGKGVLEIERELIAMGAERHEANGTVTISLDGCPNAISWTR